MDRIIIINNVEYMNAAEIEKTYDLFSGSIRQDIRRDKTRKKPKFLEGEYIKSGRDWLVSIEAVKRIYKKGDNKMERIEVGQCIPKFINAPEGVRFDMTDSGATLTICFNQPTNTEIESIKKGKLEFGMFVKEDIIFILSKFEGMKWMDSPFHIKLAKNLTLLQDAQAGQGYALHITLIDTKNGEIKAMRLVGLNTQFSKKLKSNIEEQQKNEFDSSSHTMKLSNIMRNYSTEDMAKFSEVNCRIK